jgi:hypothetical protein
MTVSHAATIGDARGAMLASLPCRSALYKNKV